MSSFWFLYYFQYYLHGPRPEERRGAGSFDCTLITFVCVCVCERRGLPWVYGIAKIRICDIADRWKGATLHFGGIPSNGDMAVGSL